MKPALHCGLAVALALFAAAGCTHRQLASSTVRTASTVMEIEYQMVLDNIAMFTCQPDALPWHVQLKEGTAQVSDEIGISGLGVYWASSPGFDGGPRGVRDISQQWGADAVTDPLEVKLLQDVYRRAIGLPPDPDPEFIRRARRERVRENRDGSGSNGSGGENEEERNGPAGDDSRSEDSRDAENGEESTRWNSTETGWQVGFSGPYLYHTTDNNSVVVEPHPSAEFDVPQGWFSVGCAEDVPVDACYVGRHGGRRVWVTPDGVRGLSQFTLIVLSIVELEAGETGSRGLMVTR